MNLGGPEMLVVLVVVLLLFGGKKIPQLAKSLGKAQQEFRTGIAEGSAEPAASPTPDVATNNVVDHPPR